jgi:hypothetical protein
MNNKFVGAVYILTNPSFPEYVKIGYADDVDARVKQLNNSEAVPFSFHIYATYDVTERLSDMKFHNFLDTINPELRSIESNGDKVRRREFYHIKPEEIYSAFENVAELTGTKDRLHLYKETAEEIDEKNEAISLAKNRHHFKSIEFHSSLTGKDYYSKTNDDGTLGIYEKNTNIEVPNNSNPSKRKILYAALEDYGGDLEGANTLYQIAHKLEKIVLKK